MIETKIGITAPQLMTPKSYEIYPLTSRFPINGLKGCMGAQFNYELNFLASRDEVLKVRNTNLIFDGNCGRLLSLSWFPKDQEAYTDKERLKMKLCDLARPFFFAYLEICNLCKKAYTQPYEKISAWHATPNYMCFNYLDGQEEVTPKVNLGGVDVELGKKTGRVIRLSWQEKINALNSFDSGQKILEAVYPFYAAYQLLTREEN